jgi:deoxycytidine triphosphate deaminase
MLSGEEIAELGLVENTLTSSFRATSYDLRAGTIIKPGGEEVTEYLIPPQGIVEIVSSESIKLPSSVSGFATVKTGLSTNGLLALNIGIIDPLYEGKISSFLVNFSKVSFLISKDDIFLRSYFFKTKESEFASKLAPPDSAYIKEKKNKIAGRFGDTFFER